MVVQNGLNRQFSANPYLMGNFGCHCSSPLIYEAKIFRFVNCASFSVPIKSFQLVKSLHFIPKWGILRWSAEKVGDLTVPDYESPVYINDFRGQ